MIQTSGNVPHTQLTVDRSSLIRVGVCAEIHVLGRLASQQIPHAAAHQAHAKATLAKLLGQHLQLRRNCICDIHHLRTHLRDQKGGNPSGMRSCTRGRLCMLLYMAMSMSCQSTLINQHMT